MNISKLINLLLGILSTHISFGNANKLCKPEDLPFLQQEVTNTYIKDVGRPFYYLLAFAPAKVTGLYNRSGFVWMEVVKYAFQKIVESLHEEGIDLNLKLRIYDSCDQIDIATLQLLDVLLGTNDIKVIGVIGPASSTMTDHFLKFLSFERYPIISYSATSVRFKDRQKYPGFMRTIPPDNFQAKLMVDIVEKYKWTYISIIAEDNEYGRMGLSELKKLFTNHKQICIAVELVFKREDTSIQNAVDSVIADKQANIIIIWASGPATINFLNEAEQRRMYDKTFILGESTNVSPQLLRNFSPRLVEGVLSIVPYSGVYHDFEEEFRVMKYSDYQKSNLWLKYFFEKYTNQNKLNSSTIADYWNLLPRTKNGNVFNALAAYTQSIKNFVLSSGECSVHETSKCLDYIVKNREDFSASYLKNVTFTNLMGEQASFDEHGDIDKSSYHIASIQQSKGRLEWKTVANWNKKDGLLVTSNFSWSEGGTEKPTSSCGVDCQPGFTYQSRAKHCCWNCIPCTGNTFKPNTGNEVCSVCPRGTYVNKEHTECRPLKHVMITVHTTAGRVIVSFASFNICLAIFIVCVFIAFRRTPVVLSSQVSVSFMQLTFLTIFNTPMFLIFGEMTNLKCITSGILVPPCFVMAIAPTLIKTQRLVKVFKSKTSRRIRDDTKFDIIKLVLTVTVQSLVVVLLIAFKGSKIKTRYVDLERLEESFSCDTRALVYIEIAFAFLIFIPVSITSFKAREFPTNYNETRVIAYGTFLCTMVMFCMLFLSESITNDINRTVCITFALLLLDLVLLVFMYVPKVWIVLFRPQLNTTQHFASQHMKTIGKLFEMTFKSKYGDHHEAASLTPICVCRAGKINYIDIKCNVSPVKDVRRSIQTETTLSSISK